LTIVPEEFAAFVFRMEEILEAAGSYQTTSKFLPDHMASHPRRQ